MFCVQLKKRKQEEKIEWGYLRDIKGKMVDLKDYGNYLDDHKKI